MKKLIAVFVAVIAIAVSTQTIRAGEMRYINKSINTRYGVDCSFWIVTRVDIRLSVNPYARVYLHGYSSADAYNLDKPAMGRKAVDIEDVENLLVTVDTTGDKNLYELVAGKIIEVVLADEQFSGGTIKTFQTE